jgi:hypothetical protein
MLVRQMPSYLLSVFAQVKVGGERPMALLRRESSPRLISRPAVHLCEVQERSSAAIDQTSTS